MECHILHSKSYISHNILLRTAALGVGEALILGLTLSVRKHRFGADLRTNFLYDIGKIKKRIEKMGLSTRLLKSVAGQSGNLSATSCQP